MDHNKELELLRQERLRIVAHAEEMELEAGRVYYELTKELQEIKAAYKDVQEKYEYSESHYQMTLRHANNLQCLLDTREDEIVQTRRHADNLQSILTDREREWEQLHRLLDSRNYELAQMQRQVDHLKNLVEARDEALEQTRRHAEHLQQMSDTWNNELMLARRHADNLQSMLDANASKKGLGMLRRVKERMRKWFK